MTSQILQVTVTR